ncbi:hypothetical protein ETI08_01115 [Macrococcoides goetzii]|nr:hypothetical protein [Macrococcus goetzii]TDM47763.1 hypothetical protein ETI08_01115 [Macrococcus goetzii]
MIKSDNEKNIIMKFIVTLAILIIIFKLLIGISVVMILGDLFNLFDANIKLWLVILVITFVMGGVLRVSAKSLVEVVEKNKEKMNM